MMSLSTKLPLASKERELLIYTQKGEVTKERGAWLPQGGRTKCCEWAAKCGREGATSPHTPNKVKLKGRAPPLLIVGCHLKRAPPLQEGRTSLTQYAHIS